MHIKGSTKINYIDLDNFYLTEKGIEFFKSRTNFQRGYSHYGVKWPVMECPLRDSEPWQELVTHSIHKPYNLLLSSSSKEGLPRHFDIKKWSIINFPLTGNYTESPMIFVDDDDQIIDQTDYNKGKSPILFNARNLHAVLPFTEDRVIVSICWVDAYDILLQKYYANQLFQEFTGEYFSYKHLKY